MKCYQKPLYWWLKSSEKLNIFGLVLLSTKLHEEMHWRFPIAGNVALRALTFVPLCGIHFWSDCNEISGTFEPWIIELANIFGNTFFSWIYVPYYMLKKMHALVFSWRFVRFSKSIVFLENTISVRCTKLFTCTQWTGWKFGQRMFFLPQKLSIRNIETLWSYSIIDITFAWRKRRSNKY